MTVKSLDQAFEDIARSDLPLIIGEDFEDIEVENNYERHYSYSGLERICLELSQKPTSKYKRIYASRVPKIVPGVPKSPFSYGPETNPIESLFIYT